MPISIGLVDFIGLGSMNRSASPIERHLCPDCHSEETEGLDKFGSPMPCAPCLVARLVKAFHADLEEPAMFVTKRAMAEDAPDRSRQLM
jgi:hypothetical protein